MEEKIIHIEERILNLQAFCSKDMSRESITGIYFDKISDTTLQAVATCGHAIAIATITNYDDVNLGYCELVGKICTFKALEKVNKIGIVKVLVTFIDGEYPNYKAVFPKDDDYNGAFGVNLELLDKLDKITKKKNHKLNLVIDLDNDGKIKDLEQLTLKPMKVDFQEKDTSVYIMPIATSKCNN